MPQFDADPTDPPSIDTSDLSGSAMDWLGWMLVVGVMLAMFAASQATVTPVARSVLGMIPGIETGGSDDGGLQLGA